MNTYSFGFVIEQTLGHITHGKNLQTLVPQDPAVRAVWGLPAWETRGLAARLPLYNSNWVVRAGLRARRELARMERARRLESPGSGKPGLDALFFHTQVTAVLALDWLRRYPSIVSLDATPRQFDRLGDFYDHETRAGWMEDLKMRLYKEAFRRARHLVTWSAWAKEGLVAEYGVPEGKVTVVPPGVNPDLWARPQPRGLENGPVKILFVGGDLQRKGGHLLIEAFRCLKALTPRRMELHLVTRETVPAEDGLFVHHGMEPNSAALIRLYHESDVFCLPTFGDCLPMVLSEAGAAGLPSVSTQVAGIPEIVLDGKTGFVTPPGDLDALVHALQALVDSPDLRLAQGQAAIEHIREHYNARRNTTHLLDLMKSIVER